MLRLSPFACFSSHSLLGASLGIQPPPPPPPPSPSVYMYMRCPKCEDKSLICCVRGCSCSGVYLRLYLG